MKIEILDEAEEDLISGYYFYEKQSEGLGRYFLDTLYVEISSLGLTAGIHSKTLGSHRYITKRFPYAIYYRLEGHTIRIEPCGIADGIRACCGDNSRDGPTKHASAHAPARRRA